MKKYNEELTFKDLVGVFIPKLWIIAAVSLVASIALGLYSEFFVKDTYTSTVTMYSYIDSAKTDINDITVAQQQVKTYEQLFKSKKFLNAVVTELSKNEEDIAAYESLSSQPKISIVQKGSTEVFDVSVTSTDAKVAHKMALAIKAVSPVLIPELIPNASEVTVFEDPEEAKVHNSKNVLRNAIIGFAGGALASMIAIFLYNLFDVIIHDRKKIEDHFNSPILAVIPRHDLASSKTSKKGRVSLVKRTLMHDTDVNDKSRLINDRTPFAISEAFRMLYTNILYLPVQDACKKSAITSGFSGEGKTYISINLALTIARSDSEHKVLLIDSDMRKPRISHLLKEVKSSAHGLSEYLAGIDSTPNIQQTNISNLCVLTSGSESANATALISSSRFGAMLKQLEDKFTYIIFDTPPVNVVSDAILLNDHINGYFIIARADYSDVNELSVVFDNLSAVEANVFGICLTAVAPKSLNKNYSRYSKYSKYGRYVKYASDVYYRK